MTTRTFVPSLDDDFSWLVSSGAVTAEQLADAERRAAEEHTTTATILLNDEVIREEHVARARAAAWGTTCIENLRTEQIDPALSHQRAWREYIRRGWLPVRRLDDGSILVATFVRPTDELRAEVVTELGTGDVTFAATARWGFRQAVLRTFADRVADDAANSLGRSDPLHSAQTTMSTPQKIGFGIALVALIVLLFLWPIPVLVWVIGAMSVAFLLATAFKFFISLRGSRYDLVERIDAEKVAALSDEDLPVYTVLVPVFREANIVGQLLGNLGRLDYPTHKLEVLILVEEEDDETQQAILDTDPPHNFHTIVIPKGQPQTKPRACNVGLEVATGEYLVIYDAEDRPDPDQLKKAVVAFQDGGEQLVVVQAALNYFNDSENVLTRMFTLEYGFWFDYMLSGLDASRLPLPLGGTSNHFRVDGLKRLGGWDPYNVTEDADLGIRAAALGWRVGVIDSVTLEEANTSIPNFIRQRSRWIKGYMQTSLVHARNPMVLIREAGLIPFLAFALLIAGTPLTFLGVIPSYLATIVSVWIRDAPLTELIPYWVMWTMLFNFLIGNVLMVYVNMMGPFKRGQFHLVPWALLNPVYWILHSIAAYKALWQLITRPHYWEKTHHGLTTQKGGAADDDVDRTAAYVPAP